MTRVHIKKGPFVQMITSCVYFYRNEHYGLCFGKKEGSSYTIEHVVSDSKAKRTPNNLELNNRRLRRIKNLESLLNCERIGDFHSHTGDSKMKAVDGPSDDDILFMDGEVNEGKDFIYVILAINDQAKKQVWSRAVYGSIYGSIGEGYYCNIGAYHFDHFSKKTGHGIYKPAKIVCPYALKSKRYL